MDLMGFRKREGTRKRLGREHSCWHRSVTGAWLPLGHIREDCDSGGAGEA